ncbi:TlpA family protein disulfide reductase [Mucilaginibacter myungsuensis]|uniref:TlpA family protein disulfide reductase n=1 Tax=Mucilaginibacter myungsuensis TaxID=649104 RepID=A0A929KTT2_9SPHI|nr:TlpA disulfide reductase family protein [Mucilaginibacter myungsuensis]MBE9660295.1 TlpA family protein disulfide reductase [Mucilaginibacter myungsuensis]MDN3600337.1 TlpA disulfide reductase family protein [Mucilaginibacter myungsuensis]
MYKTLSALAIFLAGATASFGQTGKDTSKVLLPKTKQPQKVNSITLHMERMAGIGPDGHTSSFQGTLEHLRKYEGGKLYPVMKNLPTDLTNMQEFCYVLDLAQFTYQGYRAGLCSKEYMESHLSGNKFNLADTVLLSKTPLKCYVSAVTGIRDGKPVYKMDVDNDGDFGNDEYRPVLKDASSEELKVSGSVPVKITYLNNDNKIVDDKQLVFVSPGHGNSAELYFAFPEFNYMRFTYKGKPYLAATTSFRRSGIIVVPDRPYFDRMANLKTIKQGQYISLGDDEFVLSRIINNGNDIVLTGADISGFGDKTIAKADAAKVSTAKKGTKISRQLGYIAPIASGININPAISSTGIVSTAKFKGKYLFIDVWGTYCGPCIAEFPHLKEVYSAFSRKDLEIIGLVDDRAPATTQQIFDKHQLPWANIQIDAKTSQTVGYKDINSYPTTFLLDREGKIIDIDLRGEALMNRLKLLIKGS